MVDGRAGGMLAGRQARGDLVERERIVAELDAVEPGERGGGGLVVALDRRRLAEAGDTLVLDLDLYDLRLVFGPARDRERLREVHRRLAGREFHGGYTSAATRP